MNTSGCSAAVREYLSRLEGSFTVRDTPEGCIVVTPYMRRDNDFIEIGVEPQPDGRLLITDYSETINYLDLSGVHVARSPEIRRQIKQIESRFGVSITEDEIRRYTDASEIGPALEAMIEAVRDVAYLVYKRLRRPPLAFDERVEKALIAREIRYTPRFAVQGKAELHTFRFHVNGRRHALIEPLWATSPHSALVKAERLAFRWLDIAGAGPRYQRFAVIDDEAGRGRLWEHRPLDVLRQYSDLVVLWTRAEELLAGLSDRQA